MPITASNSLEQLYTAGMEGTCYMDLEVTMSRHGPRTHVGVCWVHACLKTTHGGPITAPYCYGTAQEQLYTGDVAYYDDVAYSMFIGHTIPY